jgi:dienelactone hydrolase
LLALTGGMLRVAGLKTRADWLKRQEAVRAKLMESFGPLPEKTPLRAQVTGSVVRNGVRIEKVVFESMPSLYVTGCIFAPEGSSGKHPAIIQVSGHGFAAFRGQGTLKMLQALARNGFVVFAMDPLGQGERIQYWDPDKKASMMGTSPTQEHSYFGDQMFISGISPGRYFAWDGIRAVDYLLSRNDVDPDRIGIFGCSGGGTQTTFIAALEPRIKASVPGCYITGFRRLLESIGPQDAEQNPYRALALGLTHGDFLQVRAPRPLLVSSTTRDFFSIQGAIETVAETRKAYQALGFPDDIGHVTDDAGHGFHGTVPDIHAFFQKVLGVPDKVTQEGPVEVNPEDVQVTSTGQLATSLKGETAFSINRKESEKLVARLERARKNPESHLPQALAEARSLSGFSTGQAEGAPVFRGRYQRDGYSVELFALPGEGDYVIPLLLFSPRGSGSRPALIYLHPKGKITDAQPGGRIESLVRKGYVVAAPDLLGTGETEPEKLGLWTYAAVMLGKSIVGIQAGDVSRVVKFLKSRAEVDPSRISGMALESMGPVLLHAAAFDPSIRSIALAGSPLSYRSVVMNRFYEVPFSACVAGALTAYDLPDLAAAVAPRKILFLRPSNQLMKQAGEEEVSEELRFPRAVYSSRSAAGNIRVEASGDLNGLADWLADR